MNAQSVNEATTVRTYAFSSRPAAVPHPFGDDHPRHVYREATSAVSAAAGSGRRTHSLGRPRS